MTSEGILAFMVGPGNVLWVNAQRQQGCVCLKRWALCCFWVVRIGNSVEHAVKLLFCCIAIPRGLGPVTSKKIMVSSYWVLPMSWDASQCITGIWSTISQSGLYHHPSTLVHTVVNMPRLGEPARGGGFRIQSEICLMQLLGPLHPATQLLFLGLFSKGKDISSWPLTWQDCSVLIMLCILWNVC